MRLGNLAIRADGPSHIGMEKGYFREQGITLMTAHPVSGAKMMAPLSAGESDVSVIFYNKDWARAYDRVAKMFTVA